MRAAINEGVSFRHLKINDKLVAKEHTLSILPPAQLDELLNVVNLLRHFVDFGWARSVDYRLRDCRRSRTEVGLLVCVRCACCLDLFLGLYPVHKPRT